MLFYFTQQSKISFNVILVKIQPNKICIIILIFFLFFFQAATPKLPRAVKKSWLFEMAHPSFVVRMTSNWPSRSRSATRAPAVAVPDNWFSHTTSPVGEKHSTFPLASVAIISNWPSLFTSTAATWKKVWTSSMNVKTITSAMKKSKKKKN